MRRVAETTAAAVDEIAYAKINLALHVRRRRVDGYHDIETIFAFAEDGDHLSIAAGEQHLELAGPFASALEIGKPSDNLVMRAATALAATLGRTEFPALRLDKRLPVAAGIGGGSADAAAAIRLLSRHLASDLDDPTIMTLARALGADVPACLASVTARGDDRGDRLMVVAAESLSGMPLLLINPCLPLPTGPVFRAWDGRDRGPLAGGDPLLAALAGRNDLEAPARTLCPALGEMLDLLDRQPGAVLVRMSGSGATCFALFDSTAKRDAADAAVAAARPDWWRLASRLR